MKLRKLSNRWLVWTVIWSFIFNVAAPRQILAQELPPSPGNPIGLPETANSQISYDEARERLAIFFRQLKKLRASFDENEFNPVARARAIGPRVEDLFHFVRDEIAYEPYQGILRMAEGTLMSRAGNACDQSLLLAELLRTHGHTVQYAQTTLSDDQARRILARTNQPPSIKWRQPLTYVPTAGDIRNFTQSGFEFDKAGMEEETEKRHMDVAFFLDELSRGFDFDHRVITQQLRAAGITPGGSDETGDLLVAAKNHCWVQVQHQGRWIDLDPAAQTLDIGKRLAKPHSVSRDLPKELSHSLRFTVYIDQFKEGKITTHTVLDKWALLRRAISHISFSLLPEPASGSMSAGLPNQEFANSFDVMWPALQVNGSNATGDPFNMAGEKVSTDPRVRQAEKLRSGTEGGIEAIIGGISGQAEKSPAPQLKRVWMTVTLVQPNGSETTVEREIALRPIGADRDKAERTLRRQILSGFQFLATGSRISMRYRVTRYLDHLLANRALLFASLGQAFQMPVENLDAVLNNKAHPYPFEILDLLYTRSALMDFNAAAHFEGLAAFAAEPQVVSFRRGLTEDPVGCAQETPEGCLKLTLGYDIMFNRIRAIETFGEQAGQKRTVEFSLQQGIIDTLSEYLLLGGGEVRNAHTVTARAIKANVPLTVIRPGNLKALEDIPLDDASRQAMARDLESGFAIVAPTQSIQLTGRSVVSWWRVNPVSGETLGMGRTGGEAVSEKAATESIPFGARVKVALLSCVLLWPIIKAIGVLRSFVFDEPVHFSSGWASETFDFVACVAVMVGAGYAFPKLFALPGIRALVPAAVGVGAGAKTLGGRPSGRPIGPRGVNESTRFARAGEGAEEFAARTERVDPRGRGAREADEFGRNEGDPIGRAGRRAEEFSGRESEPVDQAGRRAEEFSGRESEPVDQASRRAEEFSGRESEPVDQAGRRAEREGGRETDERVRNLRDEAESENVREARLRREARRRETAREERYEGLTEDIQEAQQSSNRNWQSLTQAQRDWLNNDPTATQDRYGIGRRKRLAYDPDQKSFKVHEGRAALQAEDAGLVEGPLERSYVPGTKRGGGGDFIDARGARWDAKGFEPGGPADPAAEGRNIVDLAQRGENILVDGDNLNSTQRSQIETTVGEGLGHESSTGKVIFVPAPGP